MQPGAHPTPRRAALLEFANTVRWGTAPSAAQQNYSENACTCISVERVSKAIVVIQSVIVDTEIVTVPAARAPIARVRCVTHRAFQQRRKNGEGRRGCVVAFETFRASRRVDLSVCVPSCYR